VAELALSNGLVALLDDEDFPWACNFMWHCTGGVSGRGGRYAYRSEGTRVSKNGKRWHNPVYLHHEVAKRMGLTVPSGSVVNHIDFTNSLDNRRANLDVRTHQQNAANAGKFKRSIHGPAPSSKYRGVSWNAVPKRYIAALTHNGKRIVAGRSELQEEAARHYDRLAHQLRGDIAVSSLNFPEEHKTCTCRP
jgi:hypothetical protein